MSAWRVVPLPTHGPLFAGAIDVYSAAFALPPYSDPDRGEEVRDRIVEVHQYREGFRAFCAVNGAGDVVGMTYGYRGAPGQWWHDAVAAALEPDVAERWLRDSYELVELAVHPAWQNQGIGTALIAALLSGVPQATCVLSTRSDSRAHRLYRRLGFQVLTEMRFAPGGAPFYIMGRPLPFEGIPVAPVGGEGRCGSA
jgi:ribosomal protein S18 acetylase RimI-like enzyme